MVEDRYRIGLLLERWLDIDPAEAAAKVVKENFWAEAFFAAWGARDPDAAMAMALGYESEHYRKMLVAAALGDIAEKDPERFFELVAELPKELLLPDLLAEAFARLAEQDPEGAMAKAEAWGDVAVKDAVRGWARRDPQAALDWVADGHETFFSTVVGEWAKVAPHDALGHLGKQASPMADRDLARAVLSEVASSGDPGAALRWVQANALARGAFLAGTVLEVAPGSPEELWRLVKENMHGYPRAEGMSKLAKQWSGAQFAEFFDRAETFSTEDKAETLGMSVAWAKTRYHEAMAYARAIEDPGRRREFTAGVINGNLRRDTLRQAIELAPEYREHFGAGTEYSDEEVAIAFLDGELREPFTSAHVVTSRFWLVAPDEGAQWVLSHPRADEIGSHARGLTQKWSDNDPKAASTWLASLEPSPARDHAAFGLVQAVVEGSPEAAFEWAATIELSEQRRAGLDLAFKKWRWNDPVAAEAALEESGLSEAERERVLNLEVGDEKN